MQNLMALPCDCPTLLTTAFLHEGVLAMTLGARPGNWPATAGHDEFAPSGARSKSFQGQVRPQYGVPRYAPNRSNKLRNSSKESQPL
jgi:hypothetical protein